jgi:PAS domain S-box
MGDERGIEILKKIIDSLKDFKISLVGKNYEYILVNKGYTEAFGFPEDEIVGKKVYEIMGEDVFEKIIKPNLERAFHGEVVNYTEWFNFPKKGKRFCDVFYYPLRDEKGEISSIIVVSHDITDIREKEEKYKRFFENAPVGFYLSTTEGKIIDCNEQLVKILGYPNKETLLKTNARELYIDPQDRKLWMEKVEKDGYISGYEVAFRKFDGTPVFVRESSRVVRDSEGKIVRFEGVIEDISEVVKGRDRIDRKLSHIALLNRITKDIIEHVEMEKMFDSIFEHLFKNIPLEFSILFLYEEENDRLKF